MKLKGLILLAILGVMAGLISIYVYRDKVPVQAPLAVNYNPYENGIYATGIIESDQQQGSNINIYPEVAGRVLQINVKDGDNVKKGAPLLSLDDTVQRKIVDKDAAQFSYAKANLKLTQAQYERYLKAYQIDKQSVSKSALDNALQTFEMAKENVKVTEAQYLSDQALLEKYRITAPVAGIIFRVVAAVGGYVSSQGAYDTYTQSLLPVVQMGVVSPDLYVRCFVDEILIPKLPKAFQLEARLFIRGEKNAGIPIHFVRLQPYTIPNIQLSSQRIERVDVRVLPLIFKFKKPEQLAIYPGQLVDIYIKGQSAYAKK